MVIVHLSDLQPVLAGLLFLARADPCLSRLAVQRERWSLVFDRLALYSTQRLLCLDRSVEIRHITEPN